MFRRIKRCLLTVTVTGAFILGLILGSGQLAVIQQAKEQLQMALSCVMEHQNLVSVFHGCADRAVWLWEQYAVPAAEKIWESVGFILYLSDFV